MGKKNNVMTGLLGAIILIIFFAVNPMTTIEIGEEYLKLFPYILVLIVALFTVKNTSHGTHKIIAFAFLGIAFALLASELNALNILVPGWLEGGLTLQYLQAILVTGFTLIGVAFE